MHYYRYIMQLKTGILHVTSETTSFATFLRDTGFPAYQSHEKGEISNIGKHQPYKDFGFSSDVSEREWTNLAGQIEDAHAFLSVHEQTLRKLISLHNVADIRFDFPYLCRLDEQILMQCNYFPPDFLRLAGDLGIGIELSHYAPTDDSEDSEQHAGQVWYRLKPRRTRLQTNRLRERCVGD